MLDKCLPRLTHDDAGLGAQGQWRRCPAAVFLNTLFPADTRFNSSIFVDICLSSQRSTA
jgi:hypothetical protein